MTPLRRVAGRTFSSAFTSRNLRLYFAGSSISQVGTWIQLVALPWLVLHITHSGAMLVRERLPEPGWFLYEDMSAAKRFQSRS